MNAERPNILFVVLDTVRAKNISAYGHHRETTPFLDRFSEEATRYRRAYAPAPWTTPSHASMFTGTYRVTHQTDREMERLTPDLPTLAELLASDGYHTVGFSNNAHVSPRFDFDRGFDQFEFNFESYNEPFDRGVSISEIRSHTGSGAFHRQLLEALRFIRERDGSLPRTALNWVYRKASEADVVSNHDRGAASTAQFVKRYVQNADSGPFFMYLNYMEAHAPYQAPEQYQYQYVEEPSVTGWGDSQADYFNGSVPNQERKLEDLKDQYDGCIRYLDAQMENLIGILRANNVLENTIVVITSDHGEAFGEHSLYEHKIGVYDELTHVPLWIRHPEGKSKTVQKPVSNRWLFPTLLELAGVSTPDHAVSTTLTDPASPGFAIESEGLPYEDVEYGTALSDRFEEPHLAYVDREKEQKLIRYDRDGSYELYPIGNESDDVSERFPERIQELSDRLEDLLRSANHSTRSDDDDTFEVDERTREHLRELGYR